MGWKQGLPVREGPAANNPCVPQNSEPRGGISRDPPRRFPVRPCLRAAGPDSVASSLAWERMTGPPAGRLRELIHLVPGSELVVWAAASSALGADIPGCDA